MTDLSRYASDLLHSRQRRDELFPASLFDEYAWEMLLALYIRNQSDDRATRADLIALVGCHQEVGDRWLNYLEEKQQIARIGESITLSGDAAVAMETYLRGMIEDLRHTEA